MLMENMAKFLFCVLKQIVTVQSTHTKPRFLFWNDYTFRSKKTIMGSPFKKKTLKIRYIQYKFYCIVPNFKGFIMVSHVGLF